jgi:hypothetical protein
MAANQNVTQLTQQTGSAATSSLFYAVTGGTTDTGLPLSVLVNNLGLTGIPTAPTPGSVVNTTQIITGAYAATYYAPLASPTFTGTPTLPTGTIAVTQSPGNITTAVATTSFVATSFAPLASPTLTGTPAAPTASTGTSTTQLATTAFVANTFSAPPALGATTPNSVTATTIAATGTITPSQTSGIVGTTTTNNANTGSVGEYISNSTTGTSLTTSTYTNATSISLTAGDWDVMGTCVFNPANTTQFNLLVSGISTTSATAPLAGNRQKLQFSTTIVSPGGLSEELVTPSVRISIAATTTVYLVGYCGFTTSTCTMDGYIRARRVR